MSPSPPIPITIITGFLGAGKTTLLNHVLQQQKGKRISVLLNDFGSINIDVELVVGVKGGITNLANGCICCSIRKDLQAAIMRIARKVEPPEHILIETSGVADPLAIARTLRRSDARGMFGLDSIVTIVDADQVRYLTGEIGELARIQIAAATTLLLNKIDLVSQDQLSATHDWLVALNPGAPVYEVTYGRAPLEVLLPARPRAWRDETMPIPEETDLSVEPVSTEADYVIPKKHDLVLDVWTYTSLVPLHLLLFQAFIDRLPEEIYRVKGFLHLAERVETRTILQKAGRQVDLTGGKGWCGTPQTWLVFIGASGSIDRASLQAELEACLAS